MTEYPTTGTAAKQKGVVAVVGFLLFVELSGGFLQGYYTPLFAKLTGHWEISDASITWFVTVQTLSAGVSVPVLAKLGDIFGHRRILRIAVVSVAVGAALVALSPGFGLALVGRVLCGPLAVWLPLELGIVHSRLPQSTARKAIGMLVASITIGSIVGSLAGGALGGLGDFRLVLLIPVIMLVLCVIAVFIAVPESTERAAPKIDTLGFLGLAATMLLLMAGLQLAKATGFGPVSIAVLAAAVAVFVLWVWWERRAEAPAVDIRMVTQPKLWPAYLISFILGAIALGAQTIIITFMAADPEQVGYGFALAPGMLSLITLVSVLPATLSSIFFAQLSSRVGLLGVIATGLVSSCLGQLLLATLNGSMIWLVIGLVITGLGMGLLLGGLPAIIAEEAPADSTGIATGLYNSLKTLGGSLASAAFGMVLAAFALEGRQTSSLSGYVTIWVVCAVACMLGLVSLLAIRRSRPHTTVVDVIAA